MHVAFEQILTKPLILSMGDCIFRYVVLCIFLILGVLITAPHTFVED
jgi:hypothetical protein